MSSNAVTQIGGVRPAVYYPPAQATPQTMKAAFQQAGANRFLQHAPLPNSSPAAADLNHDGQYTGGYDIKNARPRAAKDIAVELWNRPEQVILMGEDHCGPPSEVLVEAVRLSDPRQYNQTKFTGLPIVATEMQVQNVGDLTRSLNNGQLTKQQFGNQFSAIMGQKGSTYPADFHQFRADNAFNALKAGAYIQPIDIDRRTNPIWRDDYMAQNVAKLVQNNPTSRIFVPVGAFHAKKYTTVPRPSNGARGENARYPLGSQLESKIGSNNVYSALFPHVKVMSSINATTRQVNYDAHPIGEYEGYYPQNGVVHQGTPCASAKK